MNKINNWIKLNYIILLIILLAVALRFYHLDYQSVWLDEICSIMEANPKINWSDLENTIIVSDPHPQLYFALLKIMFLLFGYTTFVARSFSAIAGILGVLSFYLLGKQLVNKKVGLLAAFLLSINYFHIYYSQEVRMYALLFLFTVLSYYRLVIFVKKNTFKNAILYGIFTGLMLFTQFFGLFVLASQLVILFIVFIKLSKESKIQFIYKSLLSGFILMMIFVPAITIFIETTKKKYTSIQPTTADTIIQIFRDFFQDSNYLIALATFLIVLFLFFIFKDKLYKNKKQSIVLLILFSWILITLILPIIRSYLVSPMIISRYFITILPPILILIAMGIDKINTKIIKITVVLIFVFTSFFELIYFYDYYNKIAKTQFREITEYVKKENPENDPVVSNLSWYLLYFFNNNQNKTQVVDRIFEDHVQDMIKDSTTINSFWYFGAFGNPLKLSDKSQEFIDEKFVVAHSLDKFDSWTKHYVKKSNQNLRYYSIPLESITLSNINDSNWFNGVSTKNNILLIDFSIKNREKFSRTAFLKFKNNKIVKIIKTEQVGNFIYLHVDQNIFLYKELIKYPTTIEILYNE